MLKKSDLSKPATLPTPYQRQALYWGGVATAFGLLLWMLRPVLTPFLLGALMAYILQPGVEWLVRNRVPRALAAFTMIAFFASLIALLALLVFAVIEKLGPQLVAQIPAFGVKLNGWLRPRLVTLGFDGPIDLTHVRGFLARRLQGGGESVAAAGLHYLRASGATMLALVSNIVLVPLVLFYLLYDRYEAFARIESFVPRRWLGKTRALVTDMDKMLSQYLRGQLLVMGILAVFYPVALALAGFDVAVPVGLYSGLAVFIPYVGFASGFTLALFAALLQFGSWYGVGAVIVVYGIGQALESLVLTPRLVGERIGLHPLAVIFALLAFGRLFGFFGILLALPVSAILATALRELRSRYVASALYKN